MLRAIANTGGGSSTASEVTVTPAGSIAATDVQAALEELDAEKQPLDATLTAMAGVTVAADKLMYATGADAFATTDLTAAGRALLDDADAAAQLVTLGAQGTSAKDATGGYAGLTLYKINFKNAANTFTNFFTNATTAERTYTFPDKDGTVAMTSDIGATALTIQGKTGAYTVVAGDLGTIINCTANTFSVTLTAAATLGSGFACWVWNTSATATHAITIDPDGAETIDGLTTIILRRGEGVQIVCDGTNWQTGTKKAMRGYAENYLSTATRPVASAANGTAIGVNSSDTGSQAVTGTGAMALGGSYASGSDSAAIAIGNNTSAYGSTGNNGVAAGYIAKASGSYSLALGGAGALASGSGSVAMGGGAVGTGPVASGVNSTAIGDSALAAQVGKIAIANGFFAASGDRQLGIAILGRSTSDATATALTSNGGAAGSTNQLVLANNQAMIFRAQVIGRRKVSEVDEVRGFEFSGLIRRGANAASTALAAAITPVLLAGDAGTATWGGVAATADTTNGGLAITVTGEAAKNIRWEAVIESAEVTYA